MRFLLDTNVLSEVRRATPNPNVVKWLHELDEDRAFVSVISLAEIRRGVALMQPGRRREALAVWLSRDMPERFAGRVLPVDEQTAYAWGDLMAQAKQRGIGLASLDGLIAAAAITHGLILATLNVKDFAELNVPLIDPSAS